MTDYWGRLGPVRAFREIRTEFDRTILVLACGDLVASFAFSLIFPFLTIYLTAELGASMVEAGLVLGAYSVASIASNALGGWLADRVGRKAVMVSSIALTATVIVAMGQVRDLAWVGALTLVLGFVDPPFIPAARAAVADVVPVERRPRAYGLLGVAASVGWIAGPSVGAGLSFLGYPALFAMSGLILAVYIVILVVALRETRPPGARADSAADRAGDRAGTPARGAARARVRVLAVFLALVVVVHAASFQWVVTLPVHAHRDLGVSISTWGLLFAVNGILILLFQLRVATASERRSKPRFMAVGSLCYAAGYLAVALIPGPGVAIPLLVVTIVLVSIGEMFVFPTEPAFVAELSPAAVRGRYQGFLGAAIGLGSAIGPPVGGAILDTLPGALLWALAAALSAVAAAGLWWLGGPAAGVTSMGVSSMSAPAAATPSAGPSSPPFD